MDKIMFHTTEAVKHDLKRPRKPKLTRESSQLKVSFAILLWQDVGPCQLSPEFQLILAEHFL